MKSGRWGGRSAKTVPCRECFGDEGTRVKLAAKSAIWPLAVLLWGLKLGPVPRADPFPSPLRDRGISSVLELAKEPLSKALAIEVASKLKVREGVNASVTKRSGCFERKRVDCG
ncbi:MAG: hypothetical protein ACKESB_01410 [Candidatus Hodgkinia cicadicola]